MATRKKGKGAMSRRKGRREQERAQWPEFKGPREPVEDEAYWVEPERAGTSMRLIYLLGLTLVVAGLIYVALNGVPYYG